MLAAAIAAPCAPAAQPLAPNGQGIRYGTFGAVNSVALYTTRPVRSTEALHALREPKRIVVRMLKDYSAEQFRDSWRERFETTLDGAAQAALRERFAQFSALFDSVRKDEELWFDALPGEGLRLSIRGASRGLVPGDDFSRFVLDAWLGSRPPSERLKRELLGLELPSPTTKPSAR
jgi:hypothetical protein